jgi:hypothetical protein
MISPPLAPLRIVDDSVEWKARLAALQNPDAEQRLLGALLIDNREFNRASAHIKDEHFSNAVHARIFSAIGTLIARGETANPVTLGPLFDQDPALKDIGGAKYLAQLAVSAIDVRNFIEYAAHIVDLWRRRSIVAECEDAIRAAAQIDLSRQGTAIAGEHVARIADLIRGAEVDGTAPLDIGCDALPIPPRAWLLGTTFCRGFLSGLIGQGAAGKTAVRLLQALSVASGRPLSGEHVFQQGRVLLVCLEDGLDELRRRVRAAMTHHGITQEELRGRLFVWAPLGRKVARQSDSSREIIAGELAIELRSLITSTKSTWSQSTPS